MSPEGNTQPSAVELAVLQGKILAQLRTGSKTQDELRDAGLDESERSFLRETLRNMEQAGLVERGDETDASRWFTITTVGWSFLEPGADSYSV